MLQRKRAARQRTASAGQRRQPLPERRVEPLDIRRVDNAVALRATPERLDARWCAVNNTAFDVDDTPLGIALDDLGDADVAPRAQLRTPLAPCPHRITKGLANRADVGTQAIRTEQQRGAGGHSDARAR